MVAVYLEEIKLYFSQYAIQEIVCVCVLELKSVISFINYWFQGGKKNVSEEILLLM